MDMLNKRQENMDKRKESYDAFIQVSRDFQNIYEDIYFVEGMNIGDPEIYDKALRLYKSVGQFVEKLELFDENLDLKKSKLKGVDDLFSNHPVTTYVNTVIDYLTGEVGKEKVEEVARHLEKFQKGEQEEPKETLEELANRIVEDLKLSKEYGEAFKQGLLSAIDTLKSKPGFSKFTVFTEGENAEGRLDVSGNSVVITIGDKVYEYNEPVEEEEELDDEYDLDESDGLDDIRYLHLKEVYGLSDETSNVLLNHVRNFDSDDVKGLNKVLDVIEYVLDLKTEFTPYDLELIRFYLKHLPFRGDDDIDSLSDRALTLAWKRHKYIRGL